VTFGTTIRIARSRHRSCMSWRADDLQFAWTVGDRWRLLMPMRDRCDTDPVRTDPYVFFVTMPRRSCGMLSDSRNEWEEAVTAPVRTRSQTECSRASSYCRKLC
jgi:hypothetical protein